MNRLGGPEQYASSSTNFAQSLPIFFDFMTMHIQQIVGHTGKILLWFFLFHLSACAPSTPTLPTTGPDYASPNLAFPPSPSAATNLTASNGVSNGDCAAPKDWPAWFAPNWLVEDCYAALQQFYMRETMTHKNQRFEFLAQGASQTLTNLPSQRTPRKYIVSMLY